MYSYCNKTDCKFENVYNSHIFCDKNVINCILNCSEPLGCYRTHIESYANNTIVYASETQSFLYGMVTARSMVTSIECSYYSSCNAAYIECNDDNGQYGKQKCDVKGLANSSVTNIAIDCEINDINDLCQLECNNYSCLIPPYPVINCYDNRNCHCFDEFQCESVIINNDYIDPTLYPTIHPTIYPTMNPIFDFSTSQMIDDNDKLIDDTKEWANINYIILSLLMIIFIGYLLIMTLIKFDKNSNLLKRVRIIALSQIIGFFWSYFCWFICICILYDDDADNRHNNVYYIIFAIFQYSSWIIGWMSFYALMVHKLYHTFNDSTFKMSKKCLYFHIIIIIFIPFWYSCITLYDELFDSISLFFAISSIGTIVISFGLLTLIISFNKNLFIVISTQHQHRLTLTSSNMMEYNQYDDDDDNDNDYHYDDDDDDDNDDNVYYEDSIADNMSNLSMTQTSMLNVVTKQSLLGSIQTFGGLSFALIILFVSALLNNNQNKAATEWILYEWCLAIYVLINLFCVYLSWKMTEYIYSTICSKCHSILILFCISLVNKRRSKSYHFNNLKSRLTIHEIN